MGVPSFYRWVSEKYSKVVVDVQRVPNEEIYDEEGDILLDTSAENPNGEFDNLYLDMNGIIHPCSHPEQGAQPETEEDMIFAVFKYIDLIFSMVRPRKLLFMAIDGVAPRAKMNQQRSRRFRSAQEAEELEECVKELRKRWSGKGLTVPPKKAEKRWDSNVITPGTPFMDKLAKGLRFFIQKRLHSDPGWKNITVILSDANVPGEGEHKIMEFIRLARAYPGYDPNTRHCLHGLDADLFMLAMSTHECHFSLLREEVLFGKNRMCSRCGQKGHGSDSCTGTPLTPEERKDPDKKPKPFQFAHIYILREYLQRELFVTNLPFEYDYERVLDDFVFLCFFVGNDFLPHLPSLEIREGAIDHLIELYKKLLPTLGGFITKDGDVDLHRVDVLLKELGKIEDNVFRRRKEDEAGFQRRQKDKSAKVKAARLAQKKRKKITAQQDGPKPLKGSDLPQSQTRRQALSEKAEQNSPGDQRDDPAQVEPAKKKSKPDSPTTSMDTSPDTAPTSSSVPDMKMAQVEDDDEAEDFDDTLKRIQSDNRDLSKRDDYEEDTVELGEEGWKERYYLQKFHSDYEKNPPLLQNLFRTYCEGLKWVFHYYYNGCASWDWFFPFHYAPFASDLKDLDKIDIKLDLGKPFAPFSQLMGVLPARSGHCLPPAYRELMSNPNSEILDFYPTTFKLDPNGKKFAWQAIALLPFIDEKRLLGALDTVEPTLTEEERRINGRGCNVIFVGADNPLANTINAAYLRYDEAKSDDESRVEINPIDSHGINGWLSFYKGCTLPGNTLQPPDLPSGLTIPYIIPIENLQAICATYHLPAYKPHITQILPGATPAKPCLSEQDFWATQNQRRFGKPRNKWYDGHNSYRQGRYGQQGFRGGNYKAHNRKGGPDYHSQPNRNDKSGRSGGRGRYSSAPPAGYIRNPRDRQPYMPTNRGPGIPGYRQPPTNRYQSQTPPARQYGYQYQPPQQFPTWPQQYPQQLQYARYVVPQQLPHGVVIQQYPHQQPGEQQQQQRQQQPQERQQQRHGNQRPESRSYR